jgi:hypothetical protein
MIQRSEKTKLGRSLRHTGKDLIDNDSTPADGNIGGELVLDNEELEKEQQRFEWQNYKKDQFRSGPSAEAIWECIDMSF